MSRGILSSKDSAQGVRLGVDDGDDTGERFDSALDRFCAAVVTVEVVDFFDRADTEPGSGLSLLSALLVGRFRDLDFSRLVPFSSVQPFVSVEDKGLCPDAELSFRLVF
jgi:hypothetical protein